MEHAQPSATTPLVENLTERELAILRLKAENRSNQDIADELVLALSTVKWYVRQAYGKLGVTDRDQAVARARLLGLLEQETSTACQPRHNLPAQTTPFIGREQERAELRRLLADPDTRLLTFLAPGGMGKTRLGLAVAEEQVAYFGDGVYVVSLAPLQAADQLVPAIAGAIGFHFMRDERSAKQQLLDFLREKHILLLLDNFEHLLDGAGLITEILQAAPKVRVLVTSRERLNLSGEAVFAVRGLTFPDHRVAQGALGYEAVWLFIQRAELARAGFELRPEDLPYIARICQLVEGMPLGIILAAAWMDVLSVAEIADEIEHSIDFLAVERRDEPPRQWSIRAVFESTWQRLSEQEQSVFMRLAVFRGGCTRHAAQALTGAELPMLQALVNKAVLSRTLQSRYEIHELLRQYGAEMLARQPAEGARVRERHAMYYAALVEAAATPVALRPELDNLMAAISYLSESTIYAGSTAGEEAVAILQEGVGDVLAMSGQYDPARAAFHEAFTLVSEQQPVRSARLRRKIGATLRAQRHPREALEHIQAAQKTLDETPLPHTASWRSEWIEVHFEAAWTYYYLVNPEENARVLEAIRPFVEKYGSPAQRSTLYHNLHNLACTRDRWTGSDEALDYAGRYLEGVKQTGSLAEIAFATFSIGNVYWYRRDWGAAETFLCASLDLAERADAVESQVLALTYLAVLYRVLRDRDKTRHFAERSIALAARSENPLYLGTAYANLACLAWRDGDLEEVQRLCAEAIAAWQQSSVPYGFHWTALWPLLGVALLEGRIRDAVDFAAAMLEPSRQRLPCELEETLSDALTAWSTNNAAAAQGRLQAAVTLAVEAGYL